MDGRRYIGKYPSIGRLMGLVSVIFLLSCGGTQQSKSEDSAIQDEVLETAPAKRLLSYWDGFNFEIGAAQLPPDDTEQKFVDFIAMFPSVPDTVVRVAVQDMLAKASANPETFSYFLGQYDHYLYDPNSPMRNEGYYEQVLRYLVKDANLPDTAQIKYQTQLDMVRLNQVGMAATDFDYLGKDGQDHRMYEGAKNYKMLVFYDPTCTHCAAIIQDLAQTPAVNNCIKNGFLDIVAISLLPDKESWIGYQSHIPDSWVNGWDEKGAVIQEGLYNIRAYPTIFLLDKNNKVLLKDAPIEVTLRYLVKQGSHH